MSFADWIKARVQVEMKLNGCHSYQWVSSHIYYLLLIMLTDHAHYPQYILHFRN